MCRTFFWAIVSPHSNHPQECFRHLHNFVRQSEEKLPVDLGSKNNYKAHDVKSSKKV